MEIIVNGKSESLTQKMNLKEFLANKELSYAKVAVEYNGEILYPEDWEQIVLTAGDVLEIIKFVGGG